MFKNYNKKKVDKILHFASPASPKDYILYPIKTLNTGSIGTKCLKIWFKK